mgnify:CR=1 FL=1
MPASGGNAPAALGLVTQEREVREQRARPLSHDVHRARVHHHHVPHVVQELRGLRSGGRAAHAFDGGAHGLGRERRAVVEAHVLAQPEAPALGLRVLPGLGQDGLGLQPPSRSTSGSYTSESTRRSAAPPRRWGRAARTSPVSRMVSESGGGGGGEQHTSAATAHSTFARARRVSTGCRRAGGRAQVPAPGGFTGGDLSSRSRPPC